MAVIPLAFLLSVLGCFHEEILFVSFNRTMAETFGKNIVLCVLPYHLSRKRRHASN